MDRETKTVTTPVDKHEVVLNAWITGRERRELQKPFMMEMSISVKGGEPELESKKAASVLEEVENKTIEIVVVSVDGETEGIINKVLDMKSEDYAFVLKEIQKVTQEKDFTKPE